MSANLSEGNMAERAGLSNLSQRKGQRALVHEQQHAEYLQQHAVFHRGRH